MEENIILSECCTDNNDELHVNCCVKLFGFFFSVCISITYEGPSCFASPKITSDSVNSQLNNSNY